MKKKILSILLCAVICINIALPVFAVLPESLTERTDEYTVVIKSGDGTIKVNNDETVKTAEFKAYGEVYYTVNYIDAEPDEFTDVDEVELYVREGETVKDRLNYENYDWQNEAFITCTKVVNAILENGLSTYIYNHAASSSTDEAEILASNLNGLIYPKNCTKAFLFVPSSDELVFSRFVNQDGETVSLSDPVTKDMVLTPVYVSASDLADDADTNSFFGKEIYSVTIVPGEGRLQRYISDGDYISDRVDDKYFEDMEKIEFVVEAGSSTLVDISTPYARLKYSDLEKADFVLQNGKSKIYSYLDEGNGKQALQAFYELVYEADETWFTDCYSIFSSFSGVDENGKTSMIRENGYSLFFLLLMWGEFHGDDFPFTTDDIDSIMEGYEAYDTLTSEEQDELITKTKEVIETVSDDWDAFLSCEIGKASIYHNFVTNYPVVGQMNGNFNDTNKNEDLLYYGDELGEYYGEQGDTYRLRTPDSDNIDYVFDHFLDQDGNVYNFGDPVTKDLVLTPVYTSRWENASSSVTGNIYVVTEDNSDESFSVSVDRAYIGEVDSHSKIYDTFTSYVDSLFTEDELSELTDDLEEFVRLFNERAYFTINEGCVSVSEQTGKLQWNYIPPLEFLNSKQSYTFDESLWTIDESGQITDYSGDVGLIGVPDTINGITVTSMSAATFAGLSDRYINDTSTSHPDENPYDYYSNYCAIWLPKTITDLQTGLTDAFIEQYKALLYSQAELLEDEQDKQLLCAEADALCAISTDESVDDCTALAYLPASYVVVDSDNPNYSSQYGFLYDKNQTELLYVPFSTEYEAYDTYSGFEIPQTVNTVSAFANFNAYGYTRSKVSLMHVSNENTVFNSYAFKICFDASALASTLYDLLGSEGLYEYFDVTTKEEVEEIISQEVLGGTAASFLLYNRQLFLLCVPTTDAETETIKSLKEGFAKYYRLYYPDANEENIESFVNEQMERFVYQSDGKACDKINRQGLVSVNAPYSLNFISVFPDSGNYYSKYSDSYVYSVSLNDIPDRYKPVEAQTLLPYYESGGSVTFTLELKRGNVHILSADSQDGNKYLDAVYRIVDSNGSVVAEISSSSDGTWADLEGLPYGEYTAMQISVDEGYDVAASQVFSITEDGQEIQITFMNSKQIEPVTSDEPSEEPSETGATDKPSDSSVTDEDNENNDATVTDSPNIPLTGRTDAVVTAALAVLLGLYTTCVITLYTIGKRRKNRK